MQLISRLNKLEKTLERMDKSKNVPVVIVEQSDNPKEFIVIAHGKTAFRGAKEAVIAFLKTYGSKDTVVIWNDILED